MSAPNDEPPLPGRADIPVQRLSRPVGTKTSKKRTAPSVAPWTSTIGDRDELSDLPSSPHDILRPPAALLPADRSRNAPIAPSTGGDGVAEESNTNATENLQNGHKSSEPKEDVKKNKVKDPYAPSNWDLFAGNARASAYTAKVFTYRSASIIWNWPEHAVRAMRRFLAPKPKPVKPVTYNLPNPAVADGNSNNTTRPARAKSSGRKSQAFWKALQWMFRKENWQILGMLVTFSLNGGFAYWVWVHVDVLLDPHEWRDRRRVTNSYDTWTTFTSVEIWIAIMLGLYNCFGFLLIILGFLVLYEELGKILSLPEINKKHQTRIAGSLNRSNRVRSQTKCCTTCSFSILILGFILWPLLACTIAPPRTRVDTYPTRCSGGAWDYRAVLDGRINPSNLTYGGIQIRDMRDGTTVSEFITENVVNATWARTEEMMVLRRLEDFIPQDREYVSGVTVRFPYMWSTYETSSWLSLGDVRRTTNGNYTAVLVDPVGNSTRTVSGEFPYLNDQKTGLRIDSLGLIPDVQRSWKSRIVDDGNCPWGPDAMLLENTDVAARKLTGEGNVVLRTDITKFGRCGELTVCANRRKQVVNGLDFAVGEEGKQTLDELLIVPLGILLAEQIRFGSCCGDGFEPYKAPAPTSSS